METSSMIDGGSPSRLPEFTPATALAFRGMARISDAKISALQPVNLGNPAEHLSFDPTSTVGS